METKKIINRIVFMLFIYSFSNILFLRIKKQTAKSDLHI